MRKSDALNLIVSVLAFICFSGYALQHNDCRYSMARATVQQPYVDQIITQISASRLISLEEKGYQSATELVPDNPDVAESEFSQRLQGGIVLRFEFGMIVVKPTAPPESLQPTALTTDAIITSSVKSKIAGQPQLAPGYFEIQTDDGVVTIHAKGVSLDQAAEVINLALGVPDVRQIVYTMPSSAWKTAATDRGTGGQGDWGSGVVE
jgi:hypothetical protein